MDNKLLLCKPKDIFVKELKTPGVYKILDDADNVKYIGSTNNLYKRYSSHKNKLAQGEHENKPLQIYSNVNNLKFIPTPTATKEDALNIEQTYLDNMHNIPTLCNIATDSRNPAKGRALSDAHKNKLSEALIGRIFSEETKAKMSNTRKGHHYNPDYKITEEHKKKISIANMNHLVSDDTKEKLKIASTGNTRALGNVRTEEQNLKFCIANGTAVVISGTSYHSYNAAARELNVSPQTVLNRCNSDKFKEWEKV